MQWLGFGKITVTSAGTPQPLASVAGPPVKVNAVKVTFDPSDGSGVTVFVKDSAGRIMSSATLSTSQPMDFVCPGANQLDLRTFSIDASTSGKGPFVAYGID